MATDQNLEPEPNDEAFCVLLWQANGGNVTEDGEPSATYEPVRGRCQQPGDCNRCVLMQSTLLSLAHQGVTSLWICPACASSIRKDAEELGISVKLPGYYAEGPCQRPNCSRGSQWGDSPILELLTVIGTVIP